MGADLYIKKLQKPVEDVWRPKFDEAVRLREAAQDKIATEAAQKLVDEAYEKLYGEVDHYFRDSYNGTSVLARLGLSWWRDMVYDVDDENADINCSPAACQQFLDKILAAGELKPATFSELSARHCKVDDGENSVEVWNEYFTKKRERLIAFLKRAIENGGMYASC